MGGLSNCHRGRGGNEEMRQTNAPSEGVMATTTKRKGIKRCLTSAVSTRCVSWSVVATVSDSAKTIGDVDQRREAMHASEARDVEGTCEAGVQQIITPCPGRLIVPETVRSTLPSGEGQSLTTFQVGAESSGLNMQTFDRCGGGETDRASGGVISATVMCSAPRMLMARKRDAISVHGFSSGALKSGRDGGRPLIAAQNSQHGPPLAAF